jgi:hypothetical protein
MTTDDRETEVLYASAISVSVALYVALQVVGWIDHDVHPWATLWGCGLVLAGTGDAVLAQGKSLKKAVAGLERLSLRDKEREAHTEAGAFVVGYMLGLPCFCFQPDVGEALKLLRTSPGALDVYKQPVAALAAQRAISGVGAGTGVGVGMGAKGLFSLTPAAKRPSSPSQQSQMPTPPVTSSSIGSKEESNARLLRQVLDVDSSARPDLQGLARLLVWLVAPVAAETAKYGSSVMSDPRRGRKLLEVLDALQAAAARRADSGDDKSQKTAAAGGNFGDGDGADDELASIRIPAEAADREALIQWAYNEASLLIRQYGNLLDGVSDYVQSGTTTIGECAMLIEQELR